MNPNEPEKKTSVARTVGPSTRDPSLIAAPSKGSDTSDEPPRNIILKQEDPCHKRFLKFLYNKDDKTICGRTCLSWICIIAYSIMYLIFLSTYTMIFLFGSLTIVKKTTDFSELKVSLQSFTQNGIGLTATPVSVLGGYPLIWYKNGDPQEYKKYVDAIDKLLLENRFKRESVNDLGPCAKPPFGYGDKPCVIIRINKLINWAAKPLDMQSANDKNAPLEVKNWIKSKKNKLWLHCSGVHSYDKEHIRSIKYYPDPPGFDPDVFPLDTRSESPLVAVQLSDFTVGLSLAVECKLWYENGASTVEFILYVKPQSVTGRIGFNSSAL